MIMELDRQAGVKVYFIDSNKTQVSSRTAKQTIEPKSEGERKKERKKKVV